MADDVTITVRVNDRTGNGFRDVNGRLRDMQGRFATAAGGMRRASDDMDRSMTTLRSSTMSLAPALSSVGAAVGVSLLPALGAAVPAAIGLGAAAATLKLGLGGVSDAVALAGQDTKKYHETLKKMGPEQRDFTKALVDAKGKFGGLGKEIQKAMLPGFTQAVKDAAPVVKILGKGMTELGGAFGDAARGAGQMFKGSGFQKDLQTNLDLGRRFIGDMLSGLPKLGSSFLSFGAASKPTLTAISGGLRDVMGKGLPGMFDGLKVGIGGSAKMLSGFFNGINSLLPAIGRFSGEVARALGPLLGEMFTSLGVRGAGALDTLGQAVKGLTPVFKDLGFGLKATTDLMRIIGPTLKDTAAAIVGSLLPSFSEVDKARGPLQRLSDAVLNNKGAIQEFARQGANAFLTLAQAGVQNLPGLLKMFTLVTGGMVTAMGGVLHAAASAFSWIPGLGGKLKAADRAFGNFKDSYVSGLITAEEKAKSFAASAGSKLAAGKLKLNINNWESQIATAKAQMKSVPAEKRAALKAKIDDLQSKVAAAKEKLASVKGRSVDVKARDRASGPIGAALRLLASLHDKSITVTTYYQQVRNKGYSGNSATGGHASGGLIRLADGGSPDGGRVAGPGTSTSDSIPAMLSDGEYVVRASAVAKYGERFMDALNQGRLRLSGFAKGGLTQGMKDARNSLRDQFGISHFGTKAGYQRSPFEKAMGAPSDLSALVSALNGARGDIKRATSGRTESHLLKELDSVGKSLIKQEKHLTSVNKALEGAKNKLNDLKSSASQLSSSVKGGVLSSANITQGAGADKTTTVASIMGGLTASRDKATAFAGALKGLKKKGLSKDLLQQIAEAGISGGGLETAGALLGASGSEIKSLNSLQSQIGKAASSAGKTTADAVYGASIKAQEKLVKSLKHQQDKLEKAMSHLAKVMEKSISKAVGKKAAGGIVGAAASGGIRGGLTLVGEQGPELADLPVGSRVLSNPDSRRKVWESMLPEPSRRSSYGYAPTGPARPQEVRLVFDFQGGRGTLERAFIQFLREYVRTNGGDIQRAIAHTQYRVGPQGRVRPG